MTAVHYETREQHNALSYPRITRDATDIQKIMGKVTTFSPLNQENHLYELLKPESKPLNV